MGRLEYSKDESDNYNVSYFDWSNGHAFKVEKQDGAVSSEIRGGQGIDNSVDRGSGNMIGNLSDLTLVNLKRVRDLKTLTK